MTEYHRDGKRFIAENCKICMFGGSESDCPFGMSVPFYLGSELAEKYPDGGYDERRFYHIDRCPEFKEKQI